MRFSLATLSGLALLGACAHVSPPAPPTPVEPAVTSLATLPLNDVERREFEQPRDPVVKMEVARRRWCSQAHGLAFEHWLWVRQFASESPQAVEAKRLAAMARERESALDSELRCAELNDLK